MHLLFFTTHKRIWGQRLGPGWVNVMCSVAPSTRIRINLKTDKYLYGYGFRPHLNGVFTHRKRINLKTLAKRLRVDALSG